MRRYLLDTNAMGDLINRRRGVDERAREARKSGARFGICIPVLGELFFGIEYSQSRDRNLERLKRALAGLVCWPYSGEAAEQYGCLAAHGVPAARSSRWIFKLRPSRWRLANVPSSARIATWRTSRN